MTSRKDTTNWIRNVLRSSQYGSSHICESIMCITICKYGTSHESAKQPRL